MLADAADDHSRNVARYAVALAQELGLPPDEVAAVHAAGLCHDLGKAAIPEEILRKPGRLTDEEYAIVQCHVPLGAGFLAGVPDLWPVARMVGDHHEHYDGTGYPNGKRGEAISLGGRILAVADALDAMLSDRPYARRKPLPAALAELDRCAGTMFDPRVVAAAHRLAASVGHDDFQAPADWSDGAPPLVDDHAAGSLAG